MSPDLRQKVVNIQVEGKYQLAKLECGHIKRYYSLGTPVPKRTTCGECWDAWKKASDAHTEQK